MSKRGPTSRRRSTFFSRKKDAAPPGDGVGAVLAAASVAAPASSTAPGVVPAQAPTSSAEATPRDAETNEQTAPSGAEDKEQAAPSEAKVSLEPPPPGPQKLARSPTRSLLARSKTRALPVPPAGLQRSKTELRLDFPCAASCRLGYGEGVIDSVTEETEAGTARPPQRQLQTHSASAWVRLAGQLPLATAPPQVPTPSPGAHERPLPACSSASLPPSGSGGAQEHAMLHPSRSALPRPAPLTTPPRVLPPMPQQVGDAASSSGNQG